MLAFPEDLVPARRRQPLLAGFVASLCRTSGWLLLLATLLAHLLLKPLLAEKYARELLLVRFLRQKTTGYAIKLTAQLGHLPRVPVHKNGKVYVEASTQTDGELALFNSVSPAPELAPTLERIAGQLARATDTAEAAAAEMAPLKFQLRSTQSHVETMGGSSLGGLRRDRRAVAECKNEIRAIKGVYLRGA